MKTDTLLRVFEHDTIQYGKSYGDNDNKVTVEKQDIENLLRYNELHHEKFFRPAYHGVKFSSYVGVIKVGRLVIEILPKVDKSLTVNTSDQIKSHYQRILLKMLHRSRLLLFDEAPDAPLRIQKTNLLQVYIEYFLRQVELLFHRGLTKKYLQSQGNQKVVKGQILFSPHLSKNYIHKERVFTRHQIFTYDHLLNQIIKRAISILIQQLDMPLLRDKAVRFSYEMADISDVSVTEEHFGAIKLNRKTAHYALALEIAKLIVLNNSPDMESGRCKIVSFLFDMNQLWERFVFYELKRKEAQFNFRVSAQQSRKFWESTTIRPDILIESGNETFILDTKWKLLSSATPSNSDLRQMFTYNNIFSSCKSLLLYPQTDTIKSEKVGKFHHELVDGNGIRNEHFCIIGFVSALDRSKQSPEINPEIGPQILRLLGIDPSI